MAFGADAGAETEDSAAPTKPVQQLKVKSKARVDCKLRKTIPIRIRRFLSREVLSKNHYACSRLQVEVGVVLFHTIDKISTLSIYFQCYQTMNIGLETGEFLVEVAGES